jgi:hypothetical protein
MLGDRRGAVEGEALPLAPLRRPHSEGRVTTMGSVLDFVLGPLFAGR